MMKGDYRSHKESIWISLYAKGQTSMVFTLKIGLIPIKDSQ